MLKTMRILYIDVILFALILLGTPIGIISQETKTREFSTTRVEVEEEYYQFHIGEKIRASIAENCVLSDMVK
jgi:hypothetical protein